MSDIVRVQFAHANNIWTEKQWYFYNPSPPSGGKDPHPQLREDTPQFSVTFFCFLMFFSVNLHFAHAYTP